MENNQSKIYREETKKINEIMQHLKMHTEIIPTSWKRKDLKDDVRYFEKRLKRRDTDISPLECFRCVVSERIFDICREGKENSWEHRYLKHLEQLILLYIDESQLQ